VPTADRAAFIFRSLDRDKDVTISNNEALGGMKENFSFTDSDGGIDLDERTRILEIPTPCCSSSLPSQETVAPVIGSSGSTARPGCG
jgi:hypothetical protein